MKEEFVFRSLLDRWVIHVDLSPTRVEGLAEK